MSPRAAVAILMSAVACAGLPAGAGAQTSKQGYVLATTEGFNPPRPVVGVVLAEGDVASKLKVVSWLPAVVVLEDQVGLFDAAASSPGCANLSPARIRCEFAQGHRILRVQAGDGDDAIDATFARPADYFFFGYGGAGNDVFANGPGDNSTYGEGGDDTIVGGAQRDFADGGAGDDRISAGAAFDTVRGGAGDDLIEGSPGADTLDGEAGRDTIFYKDRTGPLTITNNAGSDDGEAGEGDDVRDMEVLIGGPAADVLRAGKTATAIRGGSGADQLLGGPGDDLLDGGPGADFIDGGAGVDTTTYASRGRGGVSVKLNKRPDDGAPNERDDVRTENVIGTGGPDKLYGDAGTNLLRGLGGNDLLNAGRGGRDRLEGGLGNDRYVARNSVLTYIACGGGNDTVSSRDAGDQLRGGCG